jgi:N-glycosylase/DNA lyase
VAPPYHLARTLLSGQCFRWTLLRGGASAGASLARGDASAGVSLARGIVDGAVVSVRQQRRGLSIEWLSRPGSSDHLLRYLGADEPLIAIEAALARDRVLARVLPRTSGTALMRQDPWECLVSFVISAFNNIPKIRLTIDRLARSFGSPIPARAPDDEEAPAPAASDLAPGALASTGWAFPTPERLADASLPSLRACALGYRADYVRALARLVADGRVDLTRITAMPYLKARTSLLELPGVGEKVVECALLFALGHREAFPVDVWVQRAVERWYFGGRTRTPREIRAWARDRFGPLTGYAQQHLFAGARSVLGGRAPS